MLLADTSLADLEGVRAVIHEGKPKSVEEAAQALASAFVERFPSTVLARVFLVLPAAKLPAAEMGFARRLVGDDARLTDKTPVLTLLGTRGAWRSGTIGGGRRDISPFRCSIRSTSRAFP